MRKVVDSVQVEKKTEIELPAIATALLLDEWRRATMDGQGGWFVRLPRERYDGCGNLWSVVRRSVNDQEVIVLICDRQQFQALTASNERLKAEREIARLLKALEQANEELGRFRRSKDVLKAAQLEETIEALEANVADERARLAGLRFEGRGSQEWEFPLDLKGTSFVLAGS